MENTHIDLDFSDHDLAKSLIDATPPDGVRISSPGQPTIRAGGGADIVFSVSFHISNLELGVFASWLALQIGYHIKKRYQEKTRINDKELTPTSDQLLVIMREVIHWQKVRDLQWQESQQKKLTDENKPSK